MEHAEIIIICGPTASGKSKLAVEVAKKLNGEVISADSMQIYRGCDVGTAKITPQEAEGVPHHLIDVVDPKDSFSVSDYERLALSAIKDVRGRQRVPIVCGGTGFYINSILYSLSYGNAGLENTEEIRKKYLEMAETEGKETVYALLKKIDPESAQKLHCNDLVRVVRALEIYEATGKKKSEIRDSYRPRFRYIAYMPDLPREKLYQRIDGRVDEMINSGWGNEVLELLRRGVSLDSQALKAIGYREIAKDLAIFNQINSTTPDIIKQNTRNYAKRQITFFKRLPNLRYIEEEELPNAADKIAKDFFSL